MLKSTSPRSQPWLPAAIKVLSMSCLMLSSVLPTTTAHPATTASSTENDITEAGEHFKNNGALLGVTASDIFINPLSGGDFKKAAGVLATLANSIESQISMPGPLMGEEALIRMQQIRPVIDEAFHRFAKDVEKWSRQHPAESRQLFTLILPAIGLTVVTFAVMSVLALGFSYFISSFGLTSIAGILSGLLAGRSLPLAGLEGMLGAAPETLYNVSFWKELDTVGANPAVLQSVFEAIEKFNKLQDEKRRELAQVANIQQSHQNYAE